MIPFIKAQMAEGHKVSVACNADEDYGQLEENGIRVCPYPFKRGMHVSNLWQAIKELRRMFQRENMDLIIPHMPLAGGVSRIAAYLIPRKPRILYVSHGLPCAPGQNKFRWLFWLITEWMLGRLTDAMFVMNQYDYNLACKSRMIRNPAHIYRIPGVGVDIDRFKPAPDTNGDSFWQSFGITDRRVVLFVGRLVREKGIFEFLEAARRLRERNYAFVVIGVGPNEGMVADYIRDHHLEDTVYTLGRRNDVVEFFQRCDLFTLPTYYFEGMPVVVLEAMACGKAVIATRHRGCEDEVIDGITGYLISIKDPVQLAEKMDYLLNNDKVRLDMGRNARQRVEQYFSLDRAVKTFCDLTNTIMDQ